MRPSHPSYHLTVTVVPTSPLSCPLSVCQLHLHVSFPSPSANHLQTHTCFATLRNIHAMIASTVFLLVPSPTDPFLGAPASSQFLISSSLEKKPSPKPSALMSDWAFISCSSMCRSHMLQVRSGVQQYSLQGHPHCNAVQDVVTLHAGQEACRCAGSGHHV